MSLVVPTSLVFCYAFHVSRLPQRRSWRLHSSGMWRRANAWRVPDFFKTTYWCHLQWSICPRVINTYEDGATILSWKFGDAGTRSHMPDERRPHVSVSSAERYVPVKGRTRKILLLLCNESHMTPLSAANLPCDWGMCSNYVVGWPSDR
jgi:hypothetical protein